MSLSLDPGIFKALDANPGRTPELFDKYVQRIKLIFELAFRKADGTPYEPSDKEKKAMLSFRGGDDMKDLFEHVSSVTDTDTFNAAVTKIRTGLQGRTNNVVQRNLLLANYPQGTKPFERWSKEISNAAKLINYENYDWKQAAVDAILLQTSNPKLRERALQDNVSYEDLFKLGRLDWEKVKHLCTFVKTSKYFRPFGTAYHLHIQEKTKATLRAEKGATIESYVYVVNDKWEQSLLGEQDAIHLGIVKLHPQGAAETVSPDNPESEAQVSRRISYPKRSEAPQCGIVSSGETQAEIDANMKKLISQFPALFSAKTGRFQGPPIKIQVHPNATPMIQPPRRIPLHYVERLQIKINKMSMDDIIEGPLELPISVTWSLQTKSGTLRRSE